ncbi:MAG TPA: hypothetical protein EYP17_06870 [Candidatus Latescibacteria bacterium]|nr:hypothetical protein [Candidatus Latescibacterota bacterium]
MTELADAASGHDKELSAAVFATPELSRKYVRQDWSSWPLDAAVLMVSTRATTTRPSRDDHGRDR